MVRQADGIHDRHDLVRLAHLADDLRDLHELVDRDAGNARDHLGCVPRVVVPQELEHRTRVPEGHIALGLRLRGARRPRERISFRLVRPGRRVVRPGGLVVPREETVGEGEALLHDEGRVRVVPDVLLVVEVVPDDVVDEPAEIRHVRAGADSQIHVREG